MYTLDTNFLETAQKLEEERNIPKEAFIEAICEGVLAAYKRKKPSHNKEDVRSVFDAETFEIGIFAPMVVVDKVEDEHNEISRKEAEQFLGEEVSIGEILEVDVTPEDFSEYGRVAVQIVRQIIKQRLNQEEHKLLQKEFEERKNKVAICQVQRLETRSDGRSDVIIDLGRIEGLLLPNQQLPNFPYKKGQRLKCFVYGFREIQRRHVILVSQAHEELLTELFRLEVPEIEEGTVEIVCKARAAGYRSKVAVRSNNPDVDAIGACVGSRGGRIQNIISELFNEKIDIVPWSEDPVEFISCALGLVQIEEIALYDNNSALVIVPEDQLSLAIGKKGQNVRLAGSLTGWKIDVRSHKENKENKENKESKESESEENKKSKARNPEELKRVVSES